MEEENGREAKLKAEITRWLIFFGVAIMLSVMTWLGWSLTNRKNPITSFTTLVSDSSVAIGIQGSAPESLDIRTEQGPALEQALLDSIRAEGRERKQTRKKRRAEGATVFGEKPRSLIRLLRAFPSLRIPQHQEILDFLRDIPMRINAQPPQEEPPAEDSPADELPPTSPP